MDSEFHLTTGLAPNPRGKRPTVYEKGRECDSAGCGQRLARLNPGPFCYVHSRKSFGRVRGVRTRNTAS
jgi:hypothetical protein